MASYTPFLNLEKPTTSERLDVLKINSNWDKIDEGVSSLNSQLANKIKSAFLSWGTSLTATDYHHGIIIVNYTAAYIVWFSGSAGNIAIRSLRVSDGSKSTTEGSVTFGADNVDGTGYTITRDGNTITITTNSNSTITMMYM